jgi:hypothetical protein
VLGSMPSGKTQIISRIGWTTLLSRQIAIESRRPPYDSCPDGKWRELITSVHRSRVSYAINVRSLRLRKKENMPQPTRDELKPLRKKLREEVSCYQLAHSSPLITPTDIRKQLNKVKTASEHFLTTPGRRWANRLARAIEDVNDAGAEPLLTKVLARGTGKRLGRLQALLGELDAVASLATVATDRHLATRWLPQIQVLTKLDVETLVPTGTCFPDPALAHLVNRLCPIWIAVTGRTAKSTSKSNGASKNYLFAGWITEVVKEAGFPQPTASQVDIIVRSRFRNKKISRTSK